MSAKLTTTLFFPSLDVYLSFSRCISEAAYRRRIVTSGQDITYAVFKTRKNSLGAKKRVTSARCTKRIFCNAVFLENSSKTDQQKKIESSPPKPFAFENNPPTKISLIFLRQGLRNYGQGKPKPDIYGNTLLTFNSSHNGSAPNPSM